MSLISHVSEPAHPTSRNCPRIPTPRPSLLPGGRREGKGVTSRKSLNNSSVRNVANDIVSGEWVEEKAHYLPAAAPLPIGPRVSSAEPGPVHLAAYPAHHVYASVGARGFDERLSPAAEAEKKKKRPLFLHNSRPPKEMYTTYRPFKNDHVIVATRAPVCHSNGGSQVKYNFQAAVSPRRRGRVSRDTNLVTMNKLEVKGPPTSAYIEE
ncbi:hypothetical protein EVAR_59855_1 [Eumeta japonica]|uniref:Uncharacterized protein n=1 Tax=Eumeta variegata TaxID=151549 RepID=A0A4C1ZA60_EUMVA|nr:hypothetical protein EVAR_59855_1 [Eumeta japonica]